MRKRRKNPDMFTPRNIVIAAGVGIGVWLLIRELRKRGMLGDSGYATKPVTKPKSQPAGASFWQRAKSVAAMPMRTQQDAPTRVQPAPTPAPVAMPVPSSAPTPAPVAMPVLQQTNIKPQYETYEPGQFDITGQPFKPTPPQPAVKDSAHEDSAYELIDLVTHKPAPGDKSASVSDAASAIAGEQLFSGRMEIQVLRDDTKSHLETVRKMDDDLLKKAAVAESRFLTAARYGSDDTAQMRKRELEGVLRDITTLRKERDAYLKRADEYANKRIEHYSNQARSGAGDITGDEVFEELSALKTKALPKQQLPSAREYEKGFKGPERKGYYERSKEAEKMFRQVNPNEALAYDVMLTSPASWDAKVKQFATERGLFQKSY